jgi:hypothetical protein
MIQLRKNTDTIVLLIASNLLAVRSNHVENQICYVPCTVLYQVAITIE